MEKLKLTIDEKGHVAIWMDGCAINGVRSVEFFWEVGEVPFHKLEFATQATKIERKYTQD